MILTINGQQAALKKGSSIEYVSENRIFTDADDYSMEIELPLADCPRNLGIFGHLTRKDIVMACPTSIKAPFSKCSQKNRHPRCFCSS